MTSTLCTITIQSRSRGEESLSCLPMALYATRAIINPTTWVVPVHTYMTCLGTARSLYLSSATMKYPEILAPHSPVAPQPLSPSALHGISCIFVLYSSTFVFAHSEYKTPTATATVRAEIYSVYGAEGIRYTKKKYVKREKKDRVKVSVKWNYKAIRWEYRQSIFHPCFLFLFFSATGDWINRKYTRQSALAHFFSSKNSSNIPACATHHSLCMRVSSTRVKIEQSLAFAWNDHSWQRLKYFNQLNKQTLVDPLQFVS